MIFVGLEKGGFYSVDFEKVVGIKWVFDWVLRVGKGMVGVVVDVLMWDGFFDIVKGEWWERFGVENKFWCVKVLKFYSFIYFMLDKLWKYLCLMLYYILFECYCC